MHAVIKYWSKLAITMAMVSPPVIGLKKKVGKCKLEQVSARFYSGVVSGGWQMVSDMMEPFESSLLECKAMQKIVSGPFKGKKF